MSQEQVYVKKPKNKTGNYMDQLDDNRNTRALQTTQTAEFPRNQKLRKSPQKQSKNIGDDDSQERICHKPKVIKVLPECPDHNRIMKNTNETRQTFKEYTTPEKWSQSREIIQNSSLENYFTYLSKKPMS